MCSDSPLCRRSVRSWHTKAEVPPGPSSLSEAKVDLQLKPGRVVPDIRKLQGRDRFDFCHLCSQSSRWLHVSLLTARTREVSGAQMFRNPGEFARHFNGAFRKRHLRVRVLAPQPTSPVSVGQVRPAKICTTFPRVSRTLRSLCGGNFSILRDIRPISRASLWSPNFNIRVALPETRFELIETGSIMSSFSKLPRDRHPADGQARHQRHRLRAAVAARGEQRERAISISLAEVWGTGARHARHHTRPPRSGYWDVLQIGGSMRANTGFL